MYLPYGYDPNKQYNIMYMMHGGGGNESSIFIESTVMKKYLDSYTSDFSKGNLYFLLCEGGSHWWDGYIVDYIYDAMPYSTMNKSSSIPLK